MKGKRLGKYSVALVQAPRQMLTAVGGRVTSQIDSESGSSFPENSLKECSIPFKGSALGISHFPLGLTLKNSTPHSMAIPRGKALDS